jgi:hypothetical protein
VRWLGCWLGEIEAKGRGKDRAHGDFGRPLIEIDYAATVDGGVPIAYLVEGATSGDAKYVRDWLNAVRTPRGVSVDHFIDARKLTS